MKKNKKLLIIGDSSFAQVACEYFTVQSGYTVVGFAVESAFRKRSELLGLPTVDFETLQEKYSPATCDIFVAIAYAQLNRLRTRLMNKCVNMGYSLASFVSPDAKIWRNADIGKHCFIFEDNVVQPFCTISENVILWSGNHIGHHSSIDSNTFVSSHVVISGHVNVGKNCFFGVNATIANNISIGSDCVLGAGAIVTNDIQENSIVRRNKSLVIDGARRFFAVSSGEV
jgi:sugar O-acyltransferase (sialic acid O-acetyltransferase NeuD family)